jgi:XTP/dITP diphosphohydrolase
MMDLLFATTNAGKLRELRRLVEGLAVRVVSPDDLDLPLPEVVEDGRTFEANAEKKAVACSRATGMHALADDSGLCVDVLYGMPGVRSARWSEDEAEPEREMARAARDEANNDKLLRALDGAPDELRGAEYKAVLVLARPDGTVAATVTGVCRGRIGYVRRGRNGFGYDPLFIPDQHPERTMAELSSEEKDAISHRGEAFRKLRPLIEELAATL